LERDIKGAAALLIDCIATFSCNEICSYPSFITYATLSNLLNLPRPQIKEKILDGPEILSVANDIPEVVSGPCWNLCVCVCTILLAKENIAFSCGVRHFVH
jgi:hypothetical protein